jgi:monoamine oxidase
MGRYRWLPDAEQIARQGRSGIHADPWSVFAYPHEALAKSSRQSRPKTICVIGAGIAGLTAAYEFAVRSGDAGDHEIVVLEASDRVGGRIRTWRTGGLTGEFGPMRIPRNHAGTLHYVNAMGLRLDPFVQRNPNALYHLGGVTVHLDDWRTLGNAYAQNRAAQYLSATLNPAASSAHAALGSLLETTGRSILEGAEWQLLTDDLSPGGRALGALSLWQFIRELQVQVRARAGRAPLVRFVPRKSAD